MAAQSKRIESIKHMIQANRLKLNDKLLINETLLKLLAKKEIKLTLDVYDSDEHNIHKPIIIFIHGNSSSKRVFKDVIAYYSKKYRIIAFDLMGHGQSTKFCDIETLNEQEINQLAEAFYNPCSMIACVKLMLEEKNIKNAHLIGWSLGGHIAYGIAVEKPDLVSSIVTIGSPPIKFSTIGLEKGLKPWFVNTLVPEWISNPKKYSANEAEKIGSHMGFTIEDSFVTEDFMESDPNMRKFLFANIKNYDHKKYAGTALDGEHFVKTSALPICLIVGENDKGIKSTYIKTFHGHLAHLASRVIVVKDAPHAVFKTHTDFFYRTVDEFIHNVMIKA